MAKIGEPIYAGKLRPLARTIITKRKQGDILTARFTTKPNKAMVQQQTIWGPKIRANANDWARLSGWKKFRWSVCAWKQGIAPDPAIGYVGWSGLTLYWLCRHQQATPPGKQPVSPCSRRATDGGASPWDYTP